MSQTVTLGGERLGVEGKMTVELDGFGYANHNLREIAQNTMAPGTIVPIRTDVLLPGDSGNMRIRARVDTLPTLGPLFSSFKLQVDAFIAPYRLYNSRMRGNMTGVGLNMSTVKLPTITLTAFPTADGVEDIDNSQVNPSCLLSYLGIRGIGIAPTTQVTRDFNASWILFYWDTYERYYANQQEKIGCVIHCGTGATLAQTITQMKNVTPSGDMYNIESLAFTPSDPIPMMAGTTITISFTGGTLPDPKQVYIKLMNAGLVSLYDLSGGAYVQGTGGATFYYNATRWGVDVPVHWQYTSNSTPNQVEPRLVTFPLSNIDDVRHEILAFNQTSSAYNINSANLAPYKYLHEHPGTPAMPNILCAQEGLGIKTYISDKHNNWLDTEYMEYVSTVSSVSTAGGSFTIDSLMLSEKVYQLMMRVAVSGGTVDDWIDATYGVKTMRKMEMPMYIGGLAQEVEFQAKYSLAATEGQPLATLAGTGRLANEWNGGNVRINEIDEPCMLMVTASLTPRVVYSQGSNWDVHLQSINDLFKPSLNQIGFQDLVTNQLAWWDDVHNGTSWVTKSAGKQPAWTNYRTKVHKAYGNFAIPKNQMFMTLNRRYEYEVGEGIKDLTTYIDPAKFNFIFAESDLSSMNFWVQVEMDLQLRRKVSARLMPNL